VGRSDQLLSVLRCFNWLKQYRATATRYDKTTVSRQEKLDLAALLK
jgi:transposase